MPDRDKLVGDCASLLTKGADHEELVAFLRQQGCSKLDSIAVLSTALKLGLGRAKELVHCSDTWRDTRQSDDQLHEIAIQALNELKTEKK